ncbi:phage protein Gp36 family protein [Flavobacterium aestivum]|uniref:phage protein Gp36 family protein n=1 Tax=Flavobacterium aestivum TaxID=3003257 RepID=UPI0022865565|nr:phage protein Gp36 family protein [Flavobacterium aestivum]
MSRFLKDTDYAVLIRNEIKNILLENYTETKLLSAEEMAIAQIKNYLAGRYDVAAIFTTLADGATTDIRNAYIVMITIDCALYHLYCSIAPNKIPEHRSNRYQDVMEWLKLIAEGKGYADLPLIKDESTGEAKDSFRLSSKNTFTNNKW